GLELLLDLLRPAPERSELDRAAGGTGAARRLVVSAEMAAQALLAGAVEHQRDRAVGTPDGGAAGGAEQDTRMPPAVEEEDGLFSARDRLAQRRRQVRRQELVGDRPSHHRDGRLRPGLDALRQSQD